MAKGKGKSKGKAKAKAKAKTKGKNKNTGQKKQEKQQQDERESLLPDVPTLREASPEDNRVIYVHGDISLENAPCPSCHSVYCDLKARSREDHIKIEQGVCSQRPNSIDSSRHTWSPKPVVFTDDMGEVNVNGSGSVYVTETMDDRGFIACYFVGSRPQPDIRLLQRQCQRQSSPRPAPSVPSASALNLLARLGLVREFPTPPTTPSFTTLTGTTPTPAPTPPPSALPRLAELREAEQEQLSPAVARRQLLVAPVLPLLHPDPSTARDIFDRAVHNFADHFGLDEDRDDDFADHNHWVADLFTSLVDHCARLDSRPAPSPLLLAAPSTDDEDEDEDDYERFKDNSSGDDKIVIEEESDSD